MGLRTCDVERRAMSDSDGDIVQFVRREPDLLQEDPLAGIDDIDATAEGVSAAGREAANSNRYYFNFSTASGAILLLDKRAPSVIDYLSLDVSARLEPSRATHTAPAMCFATPLLAPTLRHMCDGSSHTPDG